MTGNERTMTEMRLMRRDINSRIKDRLTELGLEFKLTSEGGGPLRYHVEGEKLSPGEAADKYLPGGFDGNYGRA